MSNLREKAREIKAAGEAERGNFEPTGTPKRVYQYWLNNTNSDYAEDIRNGVRRENFCHFWRVVAIWAPLTFLGKKVGEPVVNAKATPFVMVAILIAAVIAGAVASVDFRIVLGIILSIAAVVAIILGGTYLLVEKTSRAVQRKIEKGFLILLGVVAVALVVFTQVMLIVDFGLVGLAWEAAALGTLAAVIFAAVKVTEFIEGRRAVKRSKRRAIEDEWIRTGEGPCPWEDTPREPGKASKFFSGVGDFLILLAQVVRVKKWKICPMVTID